MKQNSQNSINDLKQINKGLSMNQQVNHQSNPVQFAKGFTLIELLVVVSILAAMAGIAVSVVGGYEQKAREELAQTEIKRIAGAILKFKQDTGYFPATGVFAKDAPSSMADFSYLFYSPVKEGKDQSSQGREILPWDLSSSRGWNGPYLSLDSVDYMRKGSCHQKQFDDHLKVFPSNVTRQQDANGVMGLADPFEAKANYTSETELCFVAKNDKGESLAKPFTGQPYQYQVAFKNNRYPDCNEGGKGCVALVSAGKDSLFENGNNDDIVRILKVN